MNNQNKISLTTYTIIDLTIISVLLCVFEFLSVKLIQWIPGIDVVYISLSLPIILIGFMRWGYKASFLPALSGIVRCLSVQMVGEIAVNYSVYLTYIIGNSLIILVILMFKLGKEKIRQNTMWTVIYIILGFVLMCLGKSIVGSIFNHNFFDLLLGFIGTELVNLVIGIIIIILINKLNVVYKDQIIYLKELEIEKQNHNKY